MPTTGSEGSSPASRTETDDVDDRLAFDSVIPQRTRACRLTAETLYYTSRVRNLLDGTQVWKTADDSIGGWAIRRRG